MKNCSVCKSRYVCVTRRHILLDGDKEIKTITGCSNDYADIVRGIRLLLAENCQFYQEDIL